MSYDVWMEADLGGPRPVRLNILSENYTSNVSPMWFESLGGRSLGVLIEQNTYAEGLIEPLTKAVADMQDRPEHYKKMEPDTGWGDRHGARMFLLSILGACKAAPKARVCVWR